MWCVVMKRRGKRDYPVTLIQSCDFDREIRSAENPVLILCIRRDYEFSSQMGILKGVLSSMSVNSGLGLKAYLVDEGIDSSLKERLGLQGSPTFLLFSGGREQGRLMGLADESGLKGFLAASLGQDMMKLFQSDI